MTKKTTLFIHGKVNYVVHIRALEQGLNHGLKKVYKVIQLNQEEW